MSGHVLHDVGDIPGSLFLPFGCLVDAFACRIAQYSLFLAYRSVKRCLDTSDTMSETFPGFSVFIRFGRSAVSLRFCMSHCPVFAVFSLSYCYFMSGHVLLLSESDFFAGFARFGRSSSLACRIA